MRMIRSVAGIVLGGFALSCGVRGGEDPGFMVSVVYGWHPIIEGVRRLAGE